ncbi:MAG TPA: hypothetical protein VNE71_13520 [Myxococcota bacterium]|nr:hypothetical protein [Myxococcota bacterium]
MRHWKRWSITLLALVLIGAPAAADHRDFAGKVSKVSKKRVTIENRQGDRRSFVRGEKTKVHGTRRDWDGIRPGDQVIVDWHLEDKPARARRVRVIEDAPGR